jgi:hypothetical protein
MFGQKWFVRRIPRNELASKTDYASGLDTVQKLLSDRLRAVGFRLFQRNFNRLQPDGLIHLINFQAGPYPLGGNEIPGLRDNVHGKFTINLGIAVPLLHRLELGATTPKKSYRFGAIETRLGTLAEGTDIWWSVAPPYPELTEKIWDLLVRFGFPFFDHFPDHLSIARHYLERGELPCVNPGRAALISAIAAHVGGDLTESIRCFEKACEEGRRPDLPKPDFVQHVEKIRLGCAIN